MATVYGNLFGNTLDANDGVTNHDDTIYGYGGPDHTTGSAATTRSSAATAMTTSTGKRQ